MCIVQFRTYLLMEKIMKVTFEQPVTFSTLDRAFTGAGIPVPPVDAVRLTVGDHVVAYISVTTGEVWECFLGKGTSETSQTYYWPSIDLCPRAWAKDMVAK